MSLDEILIAYRAGQSSDVELRTEIRRSRAASTQVARLEIAAYLVQYLARELGIPAAQLDHDAELAQYGLDSLAARRLIRELDEHFAIAVTGRDLLAHATIAALTGVIHARLAAPSTDAAPGPQHAPRDYLRDFRLGHLDLEQIKQLIAQGMVA